MPERQKEQETGFKHIIRIVNTDLKGEKSIITALRKIKGVSFSIANALCNLTGINPRKKAGELSDSEVETLDSTLKGFSGMKVPKWMLNRRGDYETGEDVHLLGPDLDFETGNDIKRLQKIRSYKGSRHASGLPVRGQRTRSNFRRNKGNVTGVKKKAAVKVGKV